MNDRYADAKLISSGKNEHPENWSQLDCVRAIMVCNSYISLLELLTKPAVGNRQNGIYRLHSGADTVLEVPVIGDYYLEPDNDVWTNTRTVVADFEYIGPLSIRPDLLTG